MHALVGWKPLSKNPLSSSGRIRCLEPLRFLRRQGYPVELYEHRRRKQYRVVVLQKLYDDDHLELARELQLRGTRVIFDLCDNHFYNPSGDPRKARQAEALRKMIGQADVVTVGTEELGRHIPVPSAVVNDGVIPPDALTALQRFKTGVRRLTLCSQEAVELLWFGVATSNHVPTGLYDLSHIMDVLEQLAREHRIRLTVVSSSRGLYRKLIKPRNVSTRYLPWPGYEEFCALANAFDICVIPFQRNPITVCKSNNRVALALYLGLPVVADLVPVTYEEFRPFCILDDWYKGLQTYISNAELRQRHVVAGSDYVRQRYMIDHTADRFAHVFDAVLNDQDPYGAAEVRASEGILSCASAR